MSPNSAIPCVLAIGGLDPSGGAGLPADARAMCAFDVHCCAIATAVIAQNTRGVERIEAVSPAMLGAQIDNLFDDIAPRAVKIGLLPNPDSVRVVAQRLRYFEGVPLIIDTVFAPSSGPVFSDDATISVLAQTLLPHAELITPNLLEARQLSGIEIVDLASLQRAARTISERFGIANILIKGGHATETGQREGAVDWLWDGREFYSFAAPRLGGIEVRGTGCLLASAIAAQRARGVELHQAIAGAKMWLSAQIEGGQAIGKGRRVAI